jgi:putative transposase
VRNVEGRPSKGAVDERIFVHYLDQQSELTDLRGDLPWLADVPCCACQGVLRDLDKAWDRAFKKLARTPRWKRKSDRPCGLSASASFGVGDAYVSFPKVGEIMAAIHRPIVGTAKAVRVVTEVDQWFAVVSAEIEIADPSPSNLAPVGIDRGVVNLLADSKGVLVENPKHLARMADRLTKAQRVLARKEKGSKNKKKAIDKLARAHRKIRRQREHILHAESKRYAKSYGLVVVEKLQIKSMTASAKGTVEAPGVNVCQKSGLNRSILSMGWGKFVDLLRYKLPERGGELVEVPAAYSSQTCSACGAVDPGSRETQADFACTSCGYRANADVNAAKVLLARGLAGQRAAPKAPKKTLRNLRRKPKDPPAAVVPTVEACGGHGMGQPVKQERGAARLRAVCVGET